MFKAANLEVQAAFREAKRDGIFVPKWRVAQALGMTDGNFSRKLRTELSHNMKSQVLAIIEDLKGEAR